MEAGRALWILAVAALGALALVPVADGAFSVVGYRTYQHSDDGTAWTQPAFNIANQLYSVAYGNGVWVAVGTNIIATSVDGMHWTPQTFPPLTVTTAYNFRDVTFGDGLFVAVGPTDAATGTAFYTSSNGVVWDKSMAVGSTLQAMQSVAYGLGLYVAVGNAGTMFVSTDASTWRPHDSGQQYVLNGVANDGAGNWVAVGAQGTILHSTDGLVWLPQVSGTVAFLGSVTYGSNLWVAVGATGTILTSPNGMAWTPATNIGNTPNPNFVGVGHGAGRFVATASMPAVNATSFSSALVTSPNGMDWETRPVSAHFLNGVNTVAYNGTHWVGAGSIWPGYPTIVRSPDGIDWIAAHPAVGDYQQGIASNGGEWVSVGRQSSIFTAPDGQNWTARYSGTCCQHLNGVAWGGGRWVAVGAAGTILTSADGKSWQAASSPTANQLYAVTHGPGQFLAVGQSGVVLSSPDGESWTRITTSLPDLYGVAYGGGNYTAVGAGGLIATSKDGESWTPRTSGTVQTLRAVAYSPNSSPAWVAVGLGGTLRTSVDSAAWTTPSSPGATQNFYGVARDDGAWVAVGHLGAAQAWTSGGGTTWAMTNSAASPAQQLAIASDLVPPLECQPMHQVAQVGETVRIGAHGGKWPYAWSAPGANAGGQGPSHMDVSYPTWGTYSVTLSDASDPSAQVTCVVEVPMPPQPLTCAPLHQNVWTGENVTLTAFGGAPTYAWALPGAIAETEAAPSVETLYLVAGDYVALVADTEGATAECTIRVTDEPIPLEIPVQPPLGYGAIPQPLSPGGASGDWQPMEPGEGHGQSGPSEAWEPRVPLEEPLWADAGPDLVVDRGAFVPLDASLSQGAATYRWVQVAGGQVSLKETDRPFTSFVADQSGVLVFEVWVTDGSGRVARDSVQVTVLEPVVLDEALPPGEEVAVDEEASGQPYVPQSVAATRLSLWPLFALAVAALVAGIAAYAGAKRRQAR